ncbi:Secretory lipase [Stigmatella aurantiaca]|uniref:Secretory lipase n=1 Tax=Stigmatella aurantiaca TaxID=41 RepID=A0A1H7YFG0_STIAU|nr:alpha/beta hydrolase [Stigmatella aurantiaca]SEM44952.1 Secretory lipase [Stigmatella aurantiaca]
MLSPPEGTDFYYPPDELLAGAHGEVIWSRPLSGEAALTAARHNELVLYRSRDVRGNPIGVSGIIALPRKPAPEGGYPVISWAHGTVGSADKCAPSRDTQDSAAHIYNKHPHELLNHFLEQGWAVVMTDYEGLGTYGPHPYLLGESQARGILDIVRAARQLYPELSHRFAIVGHSQGGQAALFGAHHAPGWTPELELRGVAALAPASSIKEQLLEGSNYSGKTGGLSFTPLFLTGAMAGDPSIYPSEVLTDEAYQLFPQAETRARAEMMGEGSWGDLPGTHQLRKRDSHSMRAFFEQLDRMHPLVAIGVPIRISQGKEDTRVRASRTALLQKELAELNKAVPLEYKEYETVSQTEHPVELGFHFGLVETDRVPLTVWLAERLT